MVRPKKLFFETEEQKKQYKRQYQQEYCRCRVNKKADAQNDQSDYRRNDAEAEKHGKHRPDVTNKQLKSERIEEDNMDILQINTNRNICQHTSEEAHAQ